MTLAVVFSLASVGGMASPSSAAVDVDVELSGDATRFVYDSQRVPSWSDTRHASSGPIPTTGPLELTRRADP
jgi:hypothetical protein